MGVRLSDVKTFRETKETVFLYFAKAAEHRRPSGILGNAINVSRPEGGLVPPGRFVPGGLLVVIVKANALTKFLEIHQIRRSVVVGFQFGKR